MDRLIGQKRAPEELTLIHRCRDGKELEAESSCLFAETHFGSPLCLIITTVEDSFCLGFLCR